MAVSGGLRRTSTFEIEVLPMPNAERNVVKPPNEMLQGLAQTRSTTPGASDPMVMSPDHARHSADPGGSGPLTRSASPVRTPDHRFNVDNAKMPQPPSATEPGTGAVPIYAFNPMGMPNRALPESDSANGH
jgi:hypothetical protein